MNKQIFCVQVWLVLWLALQSWAQPKTGTSTKNCPWKTNLTDSDVENLPTHKYAVLEDCLYYFLSQQADKDYEKPNSLVLLPPTKDKSILEIFVHKIMVRQMWMNEIWKEMHINGYMLLSWQDLRLKWDSFKWKLDKLKIKTYGHLWMPDIYSDRYQTSIQANDFTIYQDISASRSGNVTARLEYRMQAMCDVDYSNFPSDLKHCCFNLRSYMFRSLLKYTILDTTGYLDMDRLQTNWDIKEIKIRTRQDDQDQTPYIQFCLRAGRKSSTLRIELTIPMVISAILVLVAPLFRNFKYQMFMKLFALLLQFMCFQFLVSKTPQVGFGDMVPKIYKFYEFTLCITLISLLMTLVISAVARMDRSLPPPHGVLLAASAINAKLCCSEDTGDEKPDQQQNHASTNYVRDWRQLFAAINNISSLGLIVIYILGVMILSI